jgi:dTDP-4-dehydrorhamnose 3,5-epimerase-like enzyme
MLPELLLGSFHSDQRGILYYNNIFNGLSIKRIYVIENSSTNLLRGWQGHKIEQRWFSAIYGSFLVKLIEIDDWDTPSKKLAVHTFILCSEKLDILHVPSGYMSSIQSLKIESKLLVMTDYSLNESNYLLKLDI